MTKDRITLGNDGLAVTVSPLGGAILSARWRGIDILMPSVTPGLASQRLGHEACFPLVPFGNRIENNAFTFRGTTHTLVPRTADPLALHGDGWLAVWDVIAQSETGLVLRHAQSAGADTPFAYEAMQTVTVDDDCLTLSMSVTNRGDAPLPYGLGFHPYFPRNPGTRLIAQAKRYWSEGHRHLPDEAGPIPADVDFTRGACLPARWLNNAFDGWTGVARIEWPASRLALTLQANACFGHFVLYCPSADSDFFCFEPMTHLPNAHTRGGNGLVVLRPGSTLSGGITLHCALLSPEAA